jgi:hypothetical protein
MSARRSIVDTGLATAAELDGIVDELAAASGWEFHSTHGPLGVQVVAEVP